jgi:hypothetical protein
MRRLGEAESTPVPAARLPLLEKREKGRTPIFFSANVGEPTRYTDALEMLATRPAWVGHLSR